jgi:hypothetical protein
MQPGKVLTVFATIVREGGRGMPEVTFYRQKRVDGGVRTGITLNGVAIYSSFEEGEDEPDPALLWFVDLRCEGSSLPEKPEEARQWLLDHSRIIKDGFSKCAKEFRLGIDPDIYPLMWSDFPNSPKGVKMTIAYAAARHAAARQLEQVLKKIGAHWKKSIQDLEPLRPAAR